MRIKLIIVISFVFCNPTICSHIVGTNLEYEILNLNDTEDSISIKLTLNVIFECESEIENSAFHLTYFDKHINENYTYIDSFNLILQTIDTLPVISYECITPLSTCNITTTYNSFVSIPFSPDKNHLFVYDRCCRNSITTNIETGSFLGVTIYTEISPDAIMAINSSPTYSTENAYSICANLQSKIDLPIQDTQNDSLSIDFCSMNYSKINGNINDIETVLMMPPPYDTIIFIQNQGYSFQDPLGNHGAILLDQQNLCLNVFPTMQGIYALAICIVEYTNGIKISESKIELQITVLECQKEINAKIDNDRVNIDGTEIISLCNESIANLNNLSNPISLIEEIAWSIDIDQDIFSSNEWELNTSIPTSGEYEGTLIVTSVNDCSDTLNLRFQVNSNFQIDFELSETNCGDDPVSFYDNSISDIPIQSYCYIINEDSFFVANPTVSFPDTGTYQIQYSITDEYGCQLELVKSFYYNPIEAEIEINNDTTLCEESLFIPSFNTQDFDSWYFENNNTLTPIQISESGFQTLFATFKGCTFSENIYIDTYDCNAKLYIPNIFSPNNDGFNDSFGPLGEDFEVITFRVFDRWGSLIFEANDNDSFWDGRMNGEVLDAGVYMYTLEYRETLLGNRLMENGSVSLIR